MSHRYLWPFLAAFVVVIMGIRDEAKSQSKQEKVNIDTVLAKQLKADAYGMKK